MIIGGLYDGFGTDRFDELYVFTNEMSLFLERRLGQDLILDLLKESRDWSFVHHEH